MKYIIISLIICSLAGCSAAQVREEFLGLSINQVQTSADKQTESYDISSADCFRKVKEAIGDMKAVISWEDKRKKYLIAIAFNSAYPTAVDTTQVGILVRSMGKGKSQTETASLNSDLARFVSKDIADRIKNPAVKRKEIVKQPAQGRVPGAY